MLKAMCEYIRRGQTSDFKLLSDAILGRTVRVKEVDSLPKAIYFPCNFQSNNELTSAFALHILAHCLYSKKRDKITKTVAF